MAYFREILAATTSSLNAPGGGTADAQAFFGTILSTFATLMGLIGIFAVYAHQRAHDERGEDTARTMRRLRNYLIGLSVTKEEVDRLIPPDLTPTEALALIQSSTGRFFDVANPPGSLSRLHSNELAAVTRPLVVQVAWLVGA
jgi:hypothetical protein